jgi:hypothetical protein
MITSGENICKPQSLSSGEIPDYFCMPDGSKYYLSKEEKKDYQYGGKCPSICPLRNNRGTCPDVDFVSDNTIAKATCEKAGCNFISNAVLDRTGPNYCTPKSQPGCITLTEADLNRSDKYLTDSANVCDRLNKGCIFDRGTDDPNIGRNGDPTCLRGCYGSKFWNNPKYIWGQGGTLQDEYKGSFLSPDLELGPIYLEAAPSLKYPKGWGGGKKQGGAGLLPPSLGIPYTLSRGRYSPPCNINEGDVGAFSSQVTGESLAGPGCKKTPPMPQYGIENWQYTCRCPYSSEIKVDAYAPCQDFELNQEKVQERDVCEGCYIDSKSGRCVLGEPTPDTESKILGCIDDPSDPDKCRVRRTVENTDCPHFCSNDVGNPWEWKSSTQCATQLGNQCFTVNPNYNQVRSKYQAEHDSRIPWYLTNTIHSSSSKCQPKDTDYLCQNCAQTSIQSIGSGTLYPNRSYCVVGGSETSETLGNTDFSDYLARKLSCPATCSGCHTGFFGEPMEPIYKLQEADNPSSAFNKGILFVPWVGNQATKNLQMEKKKFNA